MRYARSAATLTVAAIVATAGLGAFAQHGKPGQTKALPKPAPDAEASVGHAAVVPAFASDYNAALSLTTDPSLELDAQTQQLYQQIADTLNGSAFVPDARLAYYNAVNNQGSYSINGWAGFVENVQSDGNEGYIVTIRVSPQITDANYGLNSIVCDNNYTEQYNITSTNTAYINSFDPGSLAGQLPLIIQL